MYIFLRRVSDDFREVGRAAEEGIDAAGRAAAVE
jgi:hypothetical protein